MFNEFANLEFTRGQFQNAIELLNRNKKDHIEKIKMTTACFNLFRKAYPLNSHTLGNMGNYPTTFCGVPIEIDETVGTYEIVYKHPLGFNVVVNPCVPKDTVYFMPDSVVGGTRERIEQFIKDPDFHKYVGMIKFDN